MPEREATVGRWGLISASTGVDGLEKAAKLSTFNARGETASKSFTFGNAWRRAQRCIIPADAMFEPDWRSGTAVATRFTRADDRPLGIDGLWDRYRDAAGQWQERFTMLTINADKDFLFRDDHQAGKMKRMVVILPEGAYADWLTVSVDHSRDFLAPPSPPTSWSQRRWADPNSAAIYCISIQFVVIEVSFARSSAPTISARSAGTMTPHQPSPAPCGVLHYTRGHAPSDPRDDDGRPG